MLLPIRDQCEDDYKLQITLNFEFSKVIIKIFYTFIIYIVCCYDLCEDYHNIGPLLLSYLQFEVLNWHFDKVPKLMSRLCFVQ